MNTPAFNPKHVIVTSAMRTGSTWLVKLLQQISGARGLYVTNGDDALKLIESTPGGVIKSHGIIDIDWPSIPLSVGMVRLVRNYKDSLISRALYTKNIRPSAGEPINEPAMRKLLAELGEVSDQEFIAQFVERCELVEMWLAEIAVMERGSDGRCFTLMYEAMMNNPYDAVAELVDALWPGWADGLIRTRDVVRASLREGLRQRKSFLRNLAVGVGGWEAWITADQSERLDDIFGQLRICALANPSCRWPEVLRAWRAGPKQS